ncbi:hypothetical protein PCE1_004065 [Barthelona sp. PCE]
MPTVSQLASEDVPAKRNVKENFHLFENVESSVIVQSGIVLTAQFEIVEDVKKIMLQLHNFNSNTKTEHYLAHPILNTEPFNACFVFNGDKGYFFAFCASVFVQELIFNPLTQCIELGGQHVWDFQSWSVHCTSNQLILGNTETNNTLEIFSINDDGSIGERTTQNIPMCHEIIDIRILKKDWVMLSINYIGHRQMCLFRIDSSECEVLPLSLNPATLLMDYNEETEKVCFFASQSYENEVYYIELTFTDDGSYETQYFFVQHDGEYMNVDGFTSITDYFVDHTSMIGYKIDHIDREQTTAHVKSFTVMDNPVFDDDQRKFVMLYPAKALGDEFLMYYGWETDTMNIGYVYGKISV